MDACSHTSKSDLDPLQLFYHIFSPIVNLMVGKLKKHLRRERKKHIFNLSTIGLTIGEKT
jgi:hypothetical protein